MRKQVSLNKRQDQYEKDTVGEDEQEENISMKDISTNKILEMIQELPSGYRLIFNLYVFEDKSHKEIAEIMEISEGTSKSQLFRAKKLLQKQINVYRNQGLK